MRVIPAVESRLRRLSDALEDLRTIDTYDMYGEGVFAKLREPSIKAAFNEFRTSEVQTALQDMVDLVDGYFVGYCVLAAFVFLFNLAVKTVFDIMNKNIRESVANLTLLFQCFADIIVGKNEFV